MVDWNMIRYITDKIGQGEDPAEIKKKLIETGYEQKLINESFTQAIPWLKPAEQEKIKALQAQSVAQPTITPNQVSQTQEQVSKPAEVVRITIKTEESKPTVQATPQQLNQDVKTESIRKEKPANKRSIWFYASIIEAIIIIILLYIILR